MPNARSPRLAFGFRKLSDLVRQTSAFDLVHPEGGALRIRSKPTSEKRRK